MQTDPTALTATFGCHIVQCEPDEILREFSPLSGDDPACARHVRRILDFFDTPDPFPIP